MRKRFDNWGIRHLKAATQLILLPSLSPTLYRIVDSDGQKYETAKSLSQPCAGSPILAN